MIVILCKLDGKMRYKADQKELTRKKIIGVAIRLIKKNGFWGIGVDGIMKKAGLTVGGFYHHFKSKEDLFNQALERALLEMRELWFSGLEGKSPNDWMDEVSRRYLNRTHRDDIEMGCPFPALAADIARSKRATRKIIQGGLDELLKVFDGHAPDVGDAGQRLDFIFGTLATCAGGLLIARSLADKELSDRVLKGCRHFLKSQTQR